VGRGWVDGGIGTVNVSRIVASRYLC